MRDLLPFNAAPTAARRGSQVARALRSYFAGKRAHVSASSPFAQCFEQEFKMREFGEDQACHRLWRDLPDNVRSNLVFAFYGEFGRRLLANSTGIGHGRGNDILLMGETVSGGLASIEAPMA